MSAVQITVENSTPWVQSVLTAFFPPFLAASAALGAVWLTSWLNHKRAQKSEMLDRGMSALALAEHLEDFVIHCSEVVQSQQSYLARAGINYTNVAAPAGTVAEVRIGDTVVPSFQGDQLSSADFKTQKAAWDISLGEALTAEGYPLSADSAEVNRPMVVAILFILVLYVTMVYGPIAAALVEMFPTNIRYTSMSLPYHIGNGWFGGFLPTTAFAMVAATGNIYYGLWYPIVVALITVVVGFLFVKEGKDVDLNA